MTIHPISSGSDANVALITAGSTNILADCGMPVKRLYSRLSPHCSPMDIAAVCLTHEHGDHSAGIRQFARDFNVPVLMSAGTFGAIPWGFTPKIAELEIGDIVVNMYRVSHDAADPRGFVFISRDGDIAAYFVDLGVIPDDFGRSLSGVRTLYIESNHDEDMLNAGPYHPSVKQRCLGPRGHLSNAQIAEFIAHEMPASVERLILGHVSKVSNDPQLAYASAKRAILRRGLNCTVEVACA